MKKVKVCDGVHYYDDVLTLDEQNKLMELFYSSFFPFYLADSGDQISVSNEYLEKHADDNTLEAPVMVHNFVNNAKIWSNEWKTIEWILHKFVEKTGIKFEGIGMVRDRWYSFHLPLRCKLNLQFRVADYDNTKYQCPHKDREGFYRQLLYYPHTSDGDTIIFNEIEPKKYEEIGRSTPIGGRFLLMDKVYYHSGQPPIVNQTRMSLNYNLR